MEIYNESGNRIFSEDFKMKYLRHEYTPAEYQDNVIWPKASTVPVFLNRNKEFDKLTIYMYMKDGGIKEASGLASELKHCFLSNINVPLMKDITLECYLQQSDLIKKNRKKYEVMYSFNAITWGTAAQADNTGDFFVDGSRPTPATIEIKNTTEGQIRGERIGIGEYRIASLKAKETITINGRDKTIESTERETVFSDMNFTTFPTLLPGAKNLDINCPEGVRITVKWRPRW